MRALGIDCATKCGWALVEDSRPERLLLHGMLDLSGRKRTISAVINELAAAAPSPDIVVIELPYLDKNVVTLRTLARLAGRFEQAFEPSGAEIQVLMASQWQREILGTFGGRKRENLKRAAVLWARASFGAVLSEDEADAAGIATCVLRRQAFSARIRKARHAC